MTSSKPSGDPKATQKQVRYALALLEDAVPGETRVGEQHIKRWGAPRERHGKSIDGWLASMGAREISVLIDRLREETA